MVSFDEKNRYEIARRVMVEADLRGRDIRDARVLEAMGAIPREAFVPAKYAGQSYDDYPLPIGMSQTISQPYIVALMTQCLALRGGEVVLEIGTGSGYQTAILAKLAAKVYTIERFGELAQSAQTVLAELGLNNIEFFIGDGSAGWPEDRRFDRIMVTAGVPQIPAPLTAQLAEGGLLVAPIGGQWTQELVVAQKHKEQLSIRNICGCRFVPLVGKYGYSEEM
ncbi:MAG: protein-L-isoaspartate(D-aspartate) O-methyltransferase [Planctomycetales bacterium]|nr:protein-L-isoaspartate(D-aspartate) O-methyltransferase [Planctomycetales bacterium]